MELHLKSIARQSALSGVDFEVGQRVVCLLISDSAGQLRREDLLEAELAAFTIDGELLCRWRRIVRDRNDDAADMKRQALGSAEDLFLALMIAEPEDSDEERTPLIPTPTASIPLLKHLLALMLERKRVVRAVPGRAGWYRHLKSGEDYYAPPVAIEPEDLLSISEALKAIV